jgi:osmoprotectant transport system ATP-binding protein
MNPNDLRLEIGYVIQKIGLFPHYTVYDNIAVVPRLKGWEEKEIRERVVDLLEVVGLDPEENMKKYPSQLSGGQKQRVGVARAMAANPPVMLMDEPFGAVDPITRNQLQNEFLSLQKKMKKTICFVTHDIDEAIKMGDKIAIMAEGKLVQFDTPENILFSPANEFVEEFVGSDRALKVLNLLKVTTIMDSYMPVVDFNDIGEKITELYKDKNNFAVVVDKNRKFKGYINLKKLIDSKKEEQWKDYIKSYENTVTEDATLKDVMVLMLENDVKNIPVIDEEKKYIGMVNFDMIKAHIGKEYESSSE